MAFVLALMGKIAAYFDERAISSILFLRSISLLMVSVLMFTREIEIANTALDVPLSDLGQCRERQQYLKAQSRARKKTE